MLIVIVMNFIFIQSKKVSGYAPKTLKMGNGGDTIAENEVRVCLTHCPLSTKEIQAHLLPCHVDFDGTAQVKSYFQQ
jgi:hypothetical protein